jgi:hypothetical protein
MNRDQMMQLAKLALVTRDPDLMAKAVQELMAAKQPEPLPLFDAPQPAVSDAGVSADSLAAALDNLPPIVAKQAPVQRVELEAVVPKAEQHAWDKTPEAIAGQACQLWHKMYGHRWMTNTGAFGANAPWVAMNLRSVIVQLIGANQDVSMRAIGKLFWERIEKIKPKGWLVQERIRQCDGYTVTEHSITPNGGRA